MSTYRYARESRSPAEKNQRKYNALQSQIFYTENLLAWQLENDYQEQAAYTVKELAKLNAKLAKLDS